MISNQPVVVATRRLPDAVEQRLQANYDARLNPDDRLYGDDELIGLAQGADALFSCHTDRLSADVIRRLPTTIRVLANISVGLDHIDLDAARSRGILVTNTPGVLADATAETTILLILGAARRAGEGERLVRSGQWNTWSPTFMLGTQVTGKRLGIVGMGDIGQVTARRARAFDMSVHYYNRRRLPPDKESGAIYHQTLEDLLPNSDFLAIHCPATPDTDRLINAARLALLPHGAILVNAARGSIVDEGALIDALQSGKLAAAGLDVYEHEPGASPALRELDNVFLLPHIGSATLETRNAMGFMVLDNLDAIFAGREAPNRVV